MANRSIPTARVGARCISGAPPGYSAGVRSTRLTTSRRQRWPLYAALWALLCIVFGSQLYLAGYVEPWSRAVAAEAVYWLSWWVLAPVVFWWCRRLRGKPLALRVAGLLAGALVAVVAAPVIAQFIGQSFASLRLCVGPCEEYPALLSAAWVRQAVNVAGVNLPVYAGFVLAWHALAFQREARDRELRAAQLESLLRQAQLDALRSQLNPHFLFNSLHSIAELVHQDPRLAERLVVQLGELLRRALESSRTGDVSLAQELDFVRDYLAIEQVRLGDRLNVTWEVDPAVQGARVPSLLLQPLVENAIRHGVANRATGGQVWIRARRDGGGVVIEIGDDGPGLAAAPAEGVGLANTRARLRATYGDDHAFDLRGDDGCVVSIRVPVNA